MNYLETGKNPMAVLSSKQVDTDRDLLKVHYRRAQKESPEFMTVFESIDQSIEVTMSTILVRAQPEPVLALYDFIMTTFVPENPSSPPTPVLPGVTDVAPPPEDTPAPSPAPAPASDKIRVRVDLQGVEGATVPLITYSQKSY